MKLIIPIDEIQWDQFRNFGLTVIVIIMFSFLLAYNLKLRRKKGLAVNIDHKILTIMVIVGINIFLFGYASTLYNDVLYAFDLEKGRIVSEEILIVEVDYYRDSCEVYDNDEKYLIRNYDYKVLEYRAIYEEIEESYLMESCVIEYFEKSKRVISIALIE